MKSILYLCTILLLAGCNNSDKTVDDMSSNQVKPQCQLTESEPCISSSCIKVHAVCSGGTVPIEEAYITLDTQHKSVAFEGNNLDAFVGFENLQPNTTYQAELTVLVDDETIKESITVTTKSASPMLSCKTTHLVVLDSGIENLSNGIILNLNELCTANGSVQYNIKSTEPMIGELYSGNNTNSYNLSDQLIIEGSKLKLLSIPNSGSSGSTNIIIEAQLAGLKEDVKVGILISFAVPAKGL